MNLNGKSALVTGASRGLGLGIAQALARAGATVYITARSEHACQEAVQALRDHGHGIGMPADLSVVSDLERLGGEFRERAVALNILVNNAGTAWSAPIDEFPTQGWDKVVDLNLRAPFLLTQALLPCLEAAASPNDPARVINMGSIEGLRVPDLPTYSYSASKAGLHHLTRVLARDLGRRSITVNAIAPGVVETKMTAALLREDHGQLRSMTPLGRLGRLEDVSAAVMYLVGPGATFVTGTVLPVDGGLSTAL